MKMIRAELTRILCSDVPNGDFSEFHPDDPACFSCALQLLVGIHNQGGAESFQLTLCSPQWLAQNHAQEDVIIGKNLLIILDFNYPRIVAWLNHYIERCTGETWLDLVKPLTRIAHWEFDDYQPLVSSQ
jgi:hypothetical protein